VNFLSECNEERINAGRLLVFDGNNNKFTAPDINGCYQVLWE